MNQSAASIESTASIHRGTAVNPGRSPAVVLHLAVAWAGSVEPIDERRSVGVEFHGSDQVSYLFLRRTGGDFSVFGNYGGRSCVGGKHEIAPAFHRAQNGKCDHLIAAHGVVKPC